MYTGIYDTFWTDKKVESLSDDAKLLFLYLITCPHRNIIGFYRLPKKYIAADLDWSVERVSKGLGMLCETGLIGYDETVSIVLVKKFLRHNPINNPNQEKAAESKVSELEDNSEEPRHLILLMMDEKGRFPVNQKAIQAIETELSLFDMLFDAVMSLESYQKCCVMFLYLSGNKPTLRHACEHFECETSTITRWRRRAIKNITQIMNENLSGKEGEKNEANQQTKSLL